jgi:cyclopropane-fatty-acyl-phospholipid synthase
MFASILKKLFRGMQYGGFEVVWPDNKREKYGPDKSEFVLHFTSNDVARRILYNASLGFGECYTEGKIKVEGDLQAVTDLAARNNGILPKGIHSLINRLLRLFSGSSARKTRKDISQHYDIGNEFYKLWLDETLTYSCAYFQFPEQDLKTAQLNKIDHLLKKLQLQPGQTLLDIGSGWGGLILQAASRYGVTAMGITHSKEQLTETRNLIEKNGLNGKVTVELADYRELKGSNRFDRIVSVGMFEHVGKAFHNHYFKTITQLLKDKGISVLHTITRNTEQATDPWLRKYIFPGCYIPSWREIVFNLPEWNLYLTDVESLRMHYAKTLDDWAFNFYQNRDTIVQMFDEKFARMWWLYLRSSASSFRFSGMDLHQFVFTKGLNNALPLTRDYMYDEEYAKS